MATLSQTDPRLQNFIQAYLDMGCSTEFAEARGTERFQEDQAALFQVEACTNFSTAKETVWLLEAARLLCCGSLGDREAVKLLEMALESLTAESMEVPRG